MKSIKGIYEYVFYRIYKWNIYLWKIESPAAFNSNLALTLIWVATLNLLFELVNRFTILNIMSPFDNIGIAFATCSVVYYCHYTLFEKELKYKKIVENYSKKNESKKMWLIKGGFVFFFFFLIMVCYIIYPYTRIK